MNKTYALICTSNGEEFIKEQIQSIVNQTKKVNQIIVFDFSSDDKTCDQIENLIINDKLHSISLIKVDSKKGPCYSFLYALKEIEKIIKNDIEYSLIYLVDQDDVWLKNKNEKIVQLIENKDMMSYPFLLHHDVFVTNKDLDIIKNSYYARHQIDYLFWNYNFSHIFNTVIGHTSVINGRLLSIINKVDYNDKFLMHDWIISIIAENFGKRVFLKEQLSYYRQHESNIVGAKKDNNFRLNKIIFIWNYSNDIYQQIKILKKSKLFSTDINFLSFLKIAYLIPGLSQKILALFVSVQYLLDFEKDKN